MSTKQSLVITCRKCGAELIRNGSDWTHKLEDRRYLNHEADPMWPARESLLARYNTESAVAAEASLDVARFERKKNEAQHRYDTAKGLSDELKRLLSEHPES